MRYDLLAIHEEDTKKFAPPGQGNLLDAVEKPNF